MLNVKDRNGWGAEEASDPSGDLGEEPIDQRPLYIFEMYVVMESF
jgi:hypothetical protein